MSLPLLALPAGRSDMYQDTIAAISTPIGEGGIGIVRISGADALAIAAGVFSGRLAPGGIRHGHICEPGIGRRIDEVLVSCMKAPHTYTREDLVEINCHGGPVALQQVLALILRQGARLAGPGEFTLRAFLNGRIDLAQAEAVLDIIRARSDAGLRQAMQGLDGRLSTAVREVRSSLMRTLARITARLDFPDDDIAPPDTAGPLQDARCRLEQLLRSAGQGILYRQGVRAAIVGRPNVGKSSLLNRLLGKERAIVTPVPGTTRDTIEECISLEDIPFVLTDTAGLTSSQDAVEALGIERSRRAIAEADLVLLALDASDPLNAADVEIMEGLCDKVVLVALNKCDLGCQLDATGLRWASVHVSALTGEGIEALSLKMVRMVLQGEAISSDALLVGNPRHQDALSRAAAHLGHALDALSSGLPEDLAAIDLTAALNALGEITGETVGEELLQTIFSSFCVGK